MTAKPRLSAGILSYKASLTGYLPVNIKPFIYVAREKSVKKFK